MTDHIIKLKVCIDGIFSLTEWWVGTKLFPFIFNIEISFFHELKETLGNQ